jgi:hypothetical protein
MKKLIAALLAGTMIFALLSSCKGGDDTSSTNSDGGAEEKAPFVLADTVLDLGEGGDFAGEKSPIRCEENSSVYKGSSYGTGDDYCVRATGTAYALFRKNNIPAGKYITKFWMRDNGVANDSFVTIYINSKEGEVFRSNGKMEWQEFMSQVMVLEEGANISVRLDVLADNVEGAIVDIDEFSFELIPYDAPDVITGENPVSYLKKIDDKTSVVYVDGKEKLIKSAFSEDLNLASFKDNGFNTFVYPFSASDDTAKIDAAIEAAVANDLYMQVYFEIGGKDCDSVADLEADSKALTDLMVRIAEKDTARKVIGLTIRNSFLDALYTGTGLRHVDTVRYMDALAKIVKTSSHPMIVGVAVPNELPNFIYNTEYIDFNGSAMDLGEMACRATPLIVDGMSRLGVVAKIADSTDVPSALMSAYAKNGFASPVAFNTNTSAKEVNKKVAMVESFLLKSTSDNKASFNTDGALDKEYVGTKRVGPISVKFEAYIYNGPVGIAVYKDNAVYCVADKPAFFSIFGVDGEGRYGLFNEAGEFVEDTERIPTSQEAMDGSYRVEYAECDVLKLFCYLITEPETGVTADDPHYNSKYVDARETPFRVNLIENGDFEKFIDPIRWNKNINKPASVKMVTDANSVSGWGGLNLYFSGNALNLDGRINLGALPAGTYGVMARFGGSEPNGKGIWVEIMTDGETYTQIPLTCKYNTQNFVTTVKLTEKKVVHFCIKAEAAYGFYGFLDNLEFVRIG